MSMLKVLLVVTSLLTAYLASQQSWLFLVGLTIGLFCAYEEFMRLKIRKFHRKKTVGKLESQLRSLPYSESEFNKQYKTVMGSQKQRSTRFERKETIRSPLINYTDGVRKTSFVQSHQVTGPKIRLFGGSTIDCQEVPDDYTIASQLQKLINVSSTFLNGYEVINYGVSGATLNANYNHFKQVEIFKNDICIFFFGANETVFPKEFFRTRSPISFVPKLRQTRDFLWRLNLLSLGRIFDNFMTFDRNHPLIDKKVTCVEKIFASINLRCRSERANFIAILQPLLHTRVPLTQFDVAISYYFPKRNWEAPLFLFEKFENRFKTESYFFDGRKIFNQTELNVYLDWVHTNYLGNEIIANYFYSIIQQQMLRG